MSENFRRDVRRERVARSEGEKSQLIAEAIMKLEAIGAVRPDAAPIVKVAVDVVKAAAEEIADSVQRAADAEERARLAEELVAGVRPHLDELEARADAAESQLVAQQEIAAAAEEQTEKAAAEQRARVAKGIMDANIAELVRSQEESLQLVKAVHAFTRDQNGQSAIVNRSEYAGGPWEVCDADGVIQVCEKRSDAIALVKRIFEQETAASKNAETLDDERRRKRRANQQPGAESPDRLPEPPAVVYSGPSKSARRKSPRIL